MMSENNAMNFDIQNILYLCKKVSSLYTYIRMSNSFVYLENHVSMYMTPEYL